MIINGTLISVANIFLLIKPGHISGLIYSMIVILEKYPGFFCSIVVTSLITLLDLGLDLLVALRLAIFFPNYEISYYATYDIKDSQKSPD